MTAVDAAWCRKRLAALRGRKRRLQPIDRLAGQLAERVEQSRARVAKRVEAAPTPRYDPALPIVAHRDELLEAIRDHQVIVVAGETGSGKTTQLPKLCLEAGRGVRGLIGCTQPRRIAARAMADRVAEELASELGRWVAYQVRFRERSSPDSYIKFMTDGILLAETAADPFFDRYDTLIIDEAHERSLNIDFLLGYLKRLLPRRPDLKLIITSATIDTERFADHFDGAPIIEVSGRGYPVDLIYQPITDDSDKEDPGGRDLYQGIADAVVRLGKADPAGDILVFLSGEREIREAGDFLRRRLAGGQIRKTEILPLYARLSSAEQRRVFHPGEARRIILSTNVAETSLTVPRIRFVIDSGYARISRYSHRSRIQRLPIEAISQASANQRSGRCGRLAPGICVRLYGEDDFNTRPEYTEPEILRTSLASVILRMLTMGLGAVEEFPFVDPPAPRMINDAYQLLFELSAIDVSRSVTDLGKRLARWPLDVRLARMVEEGARRGCLEDLMVLAAALSIQDPRERPLDAQSAADQAHERFRDEGSDFLTLLKLWRYLRELRKSISGNQFRKRCRREFMNWQRVLEWFDLYQQLRDQAREGRLPLSGRHGDEESIHKSLLAGLLSHCGLKQPDNPGYSGARSREFFIFPGSGLFGSSPRWLMAAEIVETSRTYARINASIRPEWIEELGAHLLKRHCFDPHWSRRRGSVLAWERVTLHGLVLVEKRRVAFADRDPGEARRIFILEALVRGELDTRASFQAHNAKIRAEVEALEHKRRKRDVLTDEHALFEFFDARVPESVNSSKAFESWLTGLGDRDRELLYLGHDVLMREDAGEAPGELFPDTLLAGGHRLALDYHFEPGHPMDGVCVTVPLEYLNTVDSGQLQWLVPGLLRDKLIALIRQLPKPIRRSLTPAPAFADALLEALADRREEPLLAACAAELGRLTGLDIEMRDLQEDRLPDHLRFLVKVTGPGGDVLASGRDLDALQESLGRRAQRRFMDRQGTEFNRNGETEWVFGTLPEQVDTPAGVPAWPALVDQETAVGARLFDTRDEAVLSHMAGVLRLLRLAIPDKLRYLRNHHGVNREALLAWSARGGAAELVEDLLERSLAKTATELPGVRDEEAFQALVERTRSRLGHVMQTQAKLLNGLLPLYGQAALALQGALAQRRPEAVADMEGQLFDLVYPGFLSDLFPGRLKHYARYLKAVLERLVQLDQDPLRDAQRMALVEPWWTRYLAALEAGCLYDEAMDAYRWLVEEYRVSLFAQRLGTDGKVSEKRLAEAWKRTGC
ncbi:MAG: ATP-dependent RNA helicase HrpA [Gammaproteobacteria bacterium]|nr:ATP-dependent RNA helicase HrpA [Gammaproteobacteria bacterium]